MAAPAAIGPVFDNSFARDLEGLYRTWEPAPVPGPRLLALNETLAVELGLDPAHLSSPEGVAMLCGASVPDGARPIAQAYAGHQFGGYSPLLGDGRALLLGEVHDIHGQRRDIHLKGSGRTPFARGGDGKAAIGPMLREYIIGEALHALGVPTTRALAVVSTGETVMRDRPLPGAILTRVASSHLRVGTFQLASAQSASAGGDADLLRRLADHAIDRHHPAARDRSDPYLGFYELVIDAQARLIAEWMLIGFVHGVMNTDNMTISGESIDFGPCAFMDRFDPATVFSSIDHQGRYAYGNQPRIAQWNLGRLAEALLPLLHEDRDTAVALATEALQSFPGRFNTHWGAGMRAKIGLVDERPTDEVLVNDLLALMHAGTVDYTGLFRALADAVAGDVDPARNLFLDRAGFDSWLSRWMNRLAEEGRDPAVVADSMNAVNPLYIPRNHMVEAALAAATDGDLGPFHALNSVLADPFSRRDGLDEYAAPAPDSFEGYVTFCGT